MMYLKELVGTDNGSGNDYTIIYYITPPPPKNYFGVHSVGSSMNEKHYIIISCYYYLATLSP